MHRDDSQEQKSRIITINYVHLSWWIWWIKSNVLSDCADQYFVPLYRCEDNALPAKIGKPWSPTVEGRAVDEGGGGDGGALWPSSPQKLHSSPKEATFGVKAYAGPMSPSKVMTWRREHFYQHVYKDQLMPPDSLVLIVFNSPIICCFKLHHAVKHIVINQKRHNVIIFQMTTEKKYSISRVP